MMHGTLLEGKLNSYMDSALVLKRFQKEKLHINIKISGSAYAWSILKALLSDDKIIINNRTEQSLIMGGSSLLFIYSFSPTLC